MFGIENLATALYARRSDSECVPAVCGTLADWAARNGRAELLLGEVVVERAVNVPVYCAHVLEDDERESSNAVRLLFVHLMISNRSIVFAWLPAEGT